VPTPEDGVSLCVRTNSIAYSPSARRGTMQHGCRACRLLALRSYSVMFTRSQSSATIGKDDGGGGGWGDLWGAFRMALEVGTGRVDGRITASTFL